MKYDSDIMLFHHRYPTSTVNVKRAAHPMSTGKFFGKNQYILVHNGVIHNASEMYKKHAAMGITYTTELEDGTFNDSESLLWDLALTLEGKQDAPTVQGRMAFICMKKTKGKLTKLFFGRNSGSPLNLLRNDTSMSLSSEGKGFSITANNLYEFDYKTKEMTFKSMLFPMYSWPVETYTGKYNVPMATSHQSYFDDDYYETYDEYYERKYNYNKREQAGAWLGKVGQERFQRLLDEYTPDVIEGETVEEETVEEALDEQTLEDMYFSQRAKPAEVEAKALTFLARYNGFFQEAYYALEQEYGDNLASNDTAETIKKRLVLEGAMEYINSDPEYTEEDSVSSIWEGGAAWAM